MRKVYFSWKPRHPAAVWCGLLLVMGVLALLFDTVLPEGGLVWKLWGFEDRTFTVGDAEVHMRLDTSGFGRYGVELLEDTVAVLRDGKTILEGYFPIDSYEALRKSLLSSESCQVAEQQEDPSSLLVFDASEGKYVYLAQIGGSGSGVIFVIPGDVTEQEALDRAHRLQFTKRS